MDDEPVGEEPEDPELQSLVGSGARHRSSWCRRWRGAIWKASAGGLAAAVSAGAVAARSPVGTSASAPLRQAMEQLEPGGKHMWVKRSEDTGCRNWKDIMVGSVSTEPSVYVCALRCRNSPGCSGFGFQGPSCNDTTKGRKEPGACSLWSGDCHAEQNDCQDDFQMEVQEGPDWLLRSWGTACSNFYDIRLGPYSIETSVSACGAKCMKHKECVGFGYQGGSCDDRKSGALPGACYLWKGECESSANTCFDDYSMSKTSNLSAAATAGLPGVSSSDDADTEVHVRKILTTINSTNTSTTVTATTTSASDSVASERAISAVGADTTGRASIGIPVPPFALHHLSLDKLKENKSLEKQVLEVLRESVAVGLGADVDPDDVDLQLSA
jgi:hypothetical protein